MWILPLNDLIWNTYESTAQRTQNTFAGIPGARTHHRLWRSILSCTAYRHTMDQISEEALHAASWNGFFAAGLFGRCLSERGGQVCNGQAPFCLQWPFIASDRCHQCLAWEMAMLQAPLLEHLIDLCSASLPGVVKKQRLLAGADLWGECKGYHHYNCSIQSHRASLQDADQPGLHEEPPARWMVLLTFFFSPLRLYGWDSFFPPLTHWTLIK